MDVKQVSTQEEVQLPQEPEKKGPLFPVPRKKKKWVKRGVILLAVLLAAWWFFLRPPGGGGGAGAAGQYIPVPASLQDLTVAVNGSGAVTPIGRRQSLLRWAEAREGRYIIEDDYDSEFRFTLRPIPTLQSIDRAGRVIYVNTFSRTLAPSLRISYMVLPKSLTERYRAQLGFYSSTVPAMEQYTLARFLDEEYFEAHINRMRKSYRAQRDAVIDTILQSPLGEHCRVSGEDAGLHFLLTIDTKCTDHVLRADAEGRGVRLSFLSDFALRPGSAPQHTLVIHYPGIDLGRLRSALSILEALLYFRDWKYKGRK